MTTLILASQSAARKTLLLNAGLRFKTSPADLDEESLTKRLLKNKKTPAFIAKALAQAKALAVAAHHPAALIIGADQVLECEGVLFSKANNKKQALVKIAQLSGKKHRLISAVCVALHNKILWSTTQTVTLHMKQLSPAQIRMYGAVAGPALTRAVGGYELESHGAWLFDKIEGDYFTVLGLPLLPLLTHLQDHHGFRP